MASKVIRDWKRSAARVAQAVETPVGVVSAKLDGLFASVSAQVAGVGPLLPNEALSGASGGRPLDTSTLIRDHRAEEAPMSTAEKLHMTEDEYLAFERASPEKHELVHGEVVAMAGASPRHNRIVGNITGALWSRLRGGPCAALPADQRVHVPRTGLYTYPDVTVVCGPLQLHPRDDLTVLNPKVVFEVLSDSTEAYDRGAKASHYRSIPELAEYVLVAQRERRVEHYRRLDGDRWLLVEHGPGDAVELAALGIVLPVDEIYEGTENYPADAPA